MKGEAWGIGLDPTTHASSITRQMQPLKWKIVNRGQHVSVAGVARLRDVLRSGQWSMMAWIKWTGNSPAKQDRVSLLSVQCGDSGPIQEMYLTKHASGRWALGCGAFGNGPNN